MGLSLDVVLGTGLGVALGNPALWGGIAMSFGGILSTQIGAAMPKISTDAVGAIAGSCVRVRQIAKPAGSTSSIRFFLKDVVAVIGHCRFIGSESLGSNQRSADTTCQRLDKSPVPDPKVDPGR